MKFMPENCHPRLQPNPDKALNWPDLECPWTVDAIRKFPYVCQDTSLIFDL
jgi:hypothetical protein